jgi:hypothetical protein
MKCVQHQGRCLSRRGTQNGVESSSTSEVDKGAKKERGGFSIPWQAEGRVGSTIRGVGDVIGEILVGMWNEYYQAPPVERGVLDGPTGLMGSGGKTLGWG